jgi:hypothetical protein
MMLFSLPGTAEPVITGFKINLQGDHQVFVLVFPVKD